jgi:hypothetical protein
MVFTDFTGQDCRTSVVSHLRDAARMVDQLWFNALAEHSDEQAIPLGEASQAIHRALIALASDLVRGVP